MVPWRLRFARLEVTMLFKKTLIIGGLFALLTACGGGNSGYVIPQETSLKPWVEPDLSEFDDTETVGAEELEDYEDYEDEEEDADGAAEEPGAASETPAAKPAANKTPAGKRQMKPATAPAKQ